MQWLATMCLLLAPDAAAADDSIVVEEALVTLIEQAEVPAREAGVLAVINVREGQIVAVGDALAHLDDTQAQLTKKRAEIELDVARAEAANDVDVRFAQKSTEVTRAELRRASESMEKYKKSVSATELDRLRLEAERAALQVEQAQEELKVAGFTERLKQNELDYAAWTLERLRIKSPLDGMVVEINQRPGEWVEPGETMFRVVRIDRLRVEAFLDAHQAAGSLAGRPVKLSIDGKGDRSAEFSGKIVFVSPEVDPVNGQVRVWAEVENRDGQLRPGVHGKLTIGPLPADTPRPAAAN
ncbi:MAG TPA: HlyD family efflux transporter periplasmic adaptor subunit [Pirellulales bacterium]|nr:HlyD family efflux transporter periplasmic adaptor subunit [Pirellulales bacterium]